jgi:hypothetical protein
MAKVSAKNCHELASFTVEVVVRGVPTRYRYVLRSDFKVLSGIKSFFGSWCGSGLSVRGEIKSKKLDVAMAWMKQQQTELLAKGGKLVGEGVQ